jgi:predicted branched-subunit amino acid permease
MSFPDSPWRHPAFGEGIRDMAGTALGMAAWGLVTGMVMAKSGLGLTLALAMTLLVFAGSAQLASLPLIVAGAPVWVVWAAALCVNLRFVIFSAGWRPYFEPWPRAWRLFFAYLAADLSYVSFMRRFPKPEPSPEQLPFFLGGALVNWFAWQSMSVLGILLAERIPTQWGLGFAGTLVLVGLAGSMLSDRATWLAAAAAAAVAVFAYALPLKLNIVAAIGAAVVIGMLMDHLKSPARSNEPGRAP